jgi:hypothetical protein
MGVERIAPKSPSWCRDFRNEDEVTIGGGSGTPRLVEVLGKNAIAIVKQIFVSLFEPDRFT